MQRPINVLLVENEPEDLEGLRKSFAEMPGAQIELEWVGELATALQRLSAGGIDAVLLNPSLPDSDGIVSFERTNAFAPDVPLSVRKFQSLPVRQRVRTMPTHSKPLTEKKSVSS